MSAKTTATMAELPGLVGTGIGTSDWLTVSQERINQFADATDDHQWIHVDPERANEGPFGGPIAHGFLTLALFIPLWSSLLEVSDATTFVNYGLNKVRFTSPVPAGSRVRLTASLAAVDEVKGGYQVTVSGVIELEGQERPAVVVEFLCRVYA